MPTASVPHFNRGWGGSANKKALPGPAVSALFPHSRAKQGKAEGLGEEFLEKGSHRDHPVVKHHLEFGDDLPSQQLAVHPPAQDSQEVHLFHNLGDGGFQDLVLWKSPNQYWNSSGLEVADLNGDGLPDLIYSNGDGFDTGFYGPPPWHGLQWLENQGGGKFIYHRIGDSPGCYSPIAVDLNGDGHLDIVTVSAFNKANDMSSVWLTAWLNDGRENFTPVPLAHSPTHLITVAAGDLDGNGVPVLVTGGFFAYPPFTGMSRVTLWRRK